MNSNKDKLKEVYILLQMICEFKCKICPYFGMKGACKEKKFQEKYSNDKKININKLKKFVEEIQEYSPEMITLSGGEPLLYSNWSIIAKHIKSLKMNVGLCTNGVYIKKYLKEIIENVDDIILDLGGTKEIQKKIRENGEGFEQVIENIKEINLEKKKLNKKTPRIRIVYVISDLSYKNMVEFYEFFKKNQIEINNFYFQHLIYISRENLKKQEKIWKNWGFDFFLWKGFEYSPKNIDFLEFYNQIKYLKKFKDVTFSQEMNIEDLKNYYNPLLKFKIKNKFECFAPWKQVDLYPNGDIMVCPEYVIGNIYKNKFKEIWNGKKINKLRNFIKKNKEFPGCPSCFYYYVSNEKY